jgi:hypothetical protein
MRTTIAAAFLLLLASCQSMPPMFTLPGEAAAQRLGPDPATKAWPRVFVASHTEESTLAELAPYCGRHLVFTNAYSEVSCVRDAAVSMIEAKPDAVLVLTSAPQISGVNSSFFVVPFYPGFVPLTTTTTGTATTAYAMRALRARLPFAYAASTAIVMDVLDRGAVTGGLLEGDVLATIDGAPAIPPKDWPTWTFYARMLEHVPGDAVDVTWVRAGVGKMSGKAKLLPPLAPHLKVADSIDVTWMPPVDVTELPDGRVEWWMSGRSWCQDDEGRYKPRKREVVAP